MHSMCWVAEEIEFSWNGCVRARKGYGVIAAANVKRITISEGKGLIVNAYRTLSSDVKNPEFAALGKRCCTELIGAGKLQGLSQRYRRSNDSAVQVDINKLDSARSEKVFEKKARTQLFS